MTFSTLIFVLALVGSAGVLGRTIGDHQAKILAALEGVLAPPEKLDVSRRSRPAAPHCAAF